MAGLKFGSLFNDVGAGFKKSLDAMGKSFEKTFKTTADTGGIDKAAAALKKLSAEAQAAADHARDLAGEFARGNGTMKDVLDAEKAATAAAEKEKEAVEDLTKSREDIIDTESKAVGISKKYKSSIADINAEFDKSIKAIVEDSKLSQASRDEALKNLKADTFKKKSMAMFTDTDAAMADGMNSVSNAITSGIETIAPELAPFMAVIEHSIGDAFKQVLELNDSLVKLQRATGGVITSAKLGYDAFGNSTKGMMSLKTATIAANVSMGEFDDAMKSLSSGGFGQTIGAAQDLSKSQEDLSKYGIEAARAMKMYGADLGPSVRNLFQNFGKGIGEATTLLKDGADKARSLGLNAAAFVKNFEGVTDLVGEVYFSTTEEMTKMAMIATQLGVSVGAMSKGLIKMNGITDLFSQQQKMAALGLDTTAKALSKIYALKQQGKGGEAARVSFAAMAKDMQKQGMTKGGAVTQQGIATLEAAGVDKEAIAGIQKLAQQAERTGIDVGQLGDTSKLSRMQQLKLAHDEAANITLEEQFGQITGLVKQAFIDPLAKLFGPIMKGILNVLKPLADIFSSVISTVMDVISIALTPLIEAFTQVSDLLSDVFTPLAGLFSTLKNALTPVFTALKGLGTFVVQFLMVPFRIIGKVIGGLFSVISSVVKVIGEKLAPVFEWFSDLFSSGGGVISNVLDTITTAFGWLGDLLGGVVGTAFEVLGKILGGVVSVFKFLWKGVQAVWDVFNKYIIQPISTVLGPVFDWLGDILSPVIDTFKALWDGIMDLVDWIESFFGGGKAETASQQFATNWDEVLGKQTEMATPTTPTATAGTGGFVAAPSATIEAANANQNYVAPQGGTKTNITVNTKVDGVISNEQSVKRPV